MSVTVKLVTSADLDAPDVKLIAEAIDEGQSQDHAADLAARDLIHQVLGVNSSDLVCVGPYGTGIAYAFGSLRFLVYKSDTEPLNIRVAPHYACSTFGKWVAIASKADLGRWLLSIFCESCLRELGLERLS